MLDEKMLEDANPESPDEKTPEATVAEEGSHEDDDKGMGGGCAIVALLFLPILYVLSVGPVAALGDKYGSSGTQEGIKIFYTPIILLMNKNEGFREFIFAYVSYIEDMF